MYQAHANEERDQTGESQAILHEQLLGPDIPPAHAEDDDDGGETCAPPADEERGPIVVKGTRGWGAGVEGHVGRGRGGSRARPPPQRDERGRGVGVVESDQLIACPSGLLEGGKS